MVPMADSNFWRDYAEKFRAVRDNAELRADWRQTVKVGEENLPPLVSWQLNGLDWNRRSIELEFITLARRCGPEIYPYIDSLAGWLEELRSRQALNDRNRGSGIESSPDGTITAHVHFGSILAVCEASAFICKLLESETLETERLERNRKEREAVATHSEAPIKEPSTGPLYTVPLRTHPRQFPNRAEWFAARLGERKWDRNKLEAFGGPDHKTTQKVLDGLPVRDAPLKRIVRGLNAHPRIKGVKFTDIPLD
jgi:hypothetical protein